MMKLNGGSNPGMKLALASKAPVVLFVIMMMTAPAGASSTGLNNIPTADTPGDREFVLQLFSNFRDERDNDHVAAFKTGLHLWDQRFEFGVDGRLGEETSGPAVIQLKFAHDFGDQLPSIAIGTANLGVRSQDRDRAGQSFNFAVMTQEFEAFRAHVGYGFQSNNNAAFFGFDKTVSFLERDLMLRTDFIQIDDQDQWLGSAGFIYFLDDHFAIESWVSVPFERGEPTFTMKLNYGFTF